MLTPGCSRLATPQYITTWPGEAFKNADQVEKQLQQAAQKAEAALQAREAFAAEVLRFCCYFQKVTGCGG